MPSLPNLSALFSARSTVPVPLAWPSLPPLGWSRLGWSRLGWSLGVSFGLTLGPAPVAQACGVLPQSQLLNTERLDDIVHIGALPWRPYRVILPYPEADVIGSVRTCVPDAYLSQSRLGPFIQVGSFTTRSEAEGVHRQFRQAGYSTRVIHRRGILAF
ncbi:MAG: hypothetical protein AAFZ80_00855 [Cyanobacteria bacterium P01_A01_bin.105]